MVKLVIIDNTYALLPKSRGKILWLGDEEARAIDRAIYGAKELFNVDTSVYI